VSKPYSEHGLELSDDVFLRKSYKDTNTRKTSNFNELGEFERKKKYKKEVYILYKK